MGYAYKFLKVLKFNKIMGCVMIYFLNEIGNFVAVNQISPREREMSLSLKTIVFKSLPQRFTYAKLNIELTTEFP